MGIAPTASASSSASIVTFQLDVGKQGRTSTFTIKDGHLLVDKPDDKKWQYIRTPLRNVVWAELADDEFELSFLAKRKNKKKASLALVHVTGQVQDDQKKPAAQFAHQLMILAYDGVEPRRRLKVFINPHSGPGKAVRHFNKKVEPLFRAARCETDVTFTTHAGHAKEVVATLPLDKFDAIITMSGDGLVHEVLNGLAAHANPRRAMGTPIGPIPTGSGNGLSLNLLGIEEGIDIFAAALNAAKGKPMPSDLFSVTQKGTRVFSFMSQCIGLMAELDLWTEHLRFLGSTRFTLGFFKGVIQHRACPVKLQIKVAESDKKEMISGLHKARSRASMLSTSAFSAAINNQEDDATLNVPSPITAKDSDGGKQLPIVSAKEVNTLPDLQHTSVNPQGDGWITFDKPLLYVYAGKGPYVSKGFMQFPVSMPHDGYIDVVVQELMTRAELLKAMDGAEDGDAYWLKSQHYFKAEAYRIEPSGHSCFAVDGEEYPFEPFQVEVHKGLASFLSPYGFYNVEFGRES